MRLQALAIPLVFVLSAGLAAEAATTLKNEAVEVYLSDSLAAGPVARVADLSRGKALLVSAAEDERLARWVPADLVPESAASALQWTVSGDAAEAGIPLKDGLRLTFVVRLSADTPIVRMHCRMANEGDAPVPVAWFPGWHGAWRLGTGAATARWWKGLSYAPEERRLGPRREIELGSRLHSSDVIEPPGTNPYWTVDGDLGRVFFALEWCGGWHAELRGDDPVFEVDVRLPPEECQLTLGPGERIDGPVLHVMPTFETELARGRAEWFRHRAALAKALFNTPAPFYPFTYNHWYTTRFDVDGDFLRRQAQLMAPYGFDAFVIDAGWYPRVGEWTPDPAKFAPGEFEALMASVDEAGVRPGIWTCPQFVTADEEALPPEVDVPGFYRKFIEGWLLDYAGTDFAAFLKAHVARMRTDYHADWWKYDQDFFTAKTRHGVMKNVSAFQDALRAVRLAQPDLLIENCQSGGRMMNEFTVLLAQAHWLRDGGKNGLEHARANFSEALGAMEFVFPWACTRWTNNPDRMDTGDAELMRYYCRSCMAGSWGLVADLGEIGGELQALLTTEIAHYRRLNGFKSYLYDVHRPTGNSPAAGVVFYSSDRAGAAVLLLRWAADGAFEYEAPLPHLADTGEYVITDADTGDRMDATGRGLRDNALTVEFPEGRMSALFFIERK